MTTSVTIPTTTLPVGARNLGPVTVPTGSAIHEVDITIDRTVSGGLNSLTASTTIALVAQFSVDAGTTWTTMASSTLSGGIYTGKGGIVHATDFFNVDFPDTLVSGGGLVRMSATVAGTSVTVAGVLTAVT